MVHDVKTTETAPPVSFTGGFGVTSSLKDLFSQISAVAGSSAPLFISGESGTGKEVAARAVHDASDRATAPFVTVNCATGNVEEQIKRIFHPETGAIKRAEGGTLVFQSACDLHPETQRKLLGFLDDNHGGQDSDKAAARVDVRVICTSGIDPATVMAQDKYRADLFFRLVVLSLTMPPLRARRADIADLSRALLAEVSDQEGKRFDTIDQDAVEALSAFDWPGNIRQLRNALHRVVVFNDGPRVTAKMVSALDLAPVTTKAAGGGDAAQTASPGAHLLGATLSDIEDWAIEETIRLTNGSLPRAARVLGVAPSTLYRKREARQRQANAPRQTPKPD